MAMSNEEFELRRKLAKLKREEATAEGKWTKEDWNECLWGKPAKTQRIADMTVDQILGRLLVWAIIGIGIISIFAIKFSR